MVCARGACSWHTGASMTDKFEITITDINQHGQGVGQASDGLVHFVDGALPGETVKVRVKQKSRSYIVSEIEDIVVSSPDRVIPPCPVFDACGGCSLQHLTYDAELRWKEARVLSALERIGKLDLSAIEVYPILGMEDPWRYRNKASYPFSGTVQDPVTGFYATRSHEIVEHRDCLLLTKETNVVKRIVIELMRRDKVAPYNEDENDGILRHLVIKHALATNELMVIFVVTKRMEIMKKWPEEIQKVLATENYKATLASVHTIENKKRSNVILKGKTTHLYGRETVTEVLNGLSYRIRPEAFFQVNTRQTEKLFSVVAKWAVEALTGREKKQALDLYCGSGTIALHLAQRGIEVTGVEIVPEAIAEAIVAANENQLFNASFVASDIVDYIQSEGVKEHVSLVVLDPPRKGSDQRLLDALIKAEHVRSIIYVSCNPATLARDLAYLSQNFSVRRLQTVDMFPHTTHVECVVLITRVKD